MANVIALVASLLERIGLRGEQAAGAFHTYATFTFGTIIFAATRQIAHEELGGEAGDGSFASAPGAARGELLRRPRRGPRSTA